ncbi:MAG TPA: hypothetical protein DCY20_04855 [Firmicutes bacterium]|nr:hypothetical protein [Bacillota bacterium]
MIFNEVYRELAKNEIDEMFESRDKLYTDQNKFGAKNYAQMHYCFKTKSDFSKEMTRSVKLAIHEFNSQKIK